MPSIIIKERDLTSAGNLSATTNAVYIPGYSNMGPTNTPTLCETLADFQMIFGGEPYKFRQAHEWSTVFTTAGTPARSDTMGKFYEKNDFEKSYIMAAELLKLGLPVLYERVFDTATDGNAAKWTATRNIGYLPTGEFTPSDDLNKPTEDEDIAAVVRATSPGLASSKLYFTLTETPAGDGWYYTIAVGRKANSDIGVNELEKVATNFTFSQAVALEYPSCKMVYSGQKFVDNSGLVEIEFGTIGEESNFRLYEGKYTTEAKANDPYEYELAHSTDLTTLLAEDEFKPENMYTMLSDSKYDATTGEPLGLYRLLDKGEYVIKYITTGAYPVFEKDASNTIASTLMYVAAERGDCTALIDHTPNNSRSLVAKKPDSVYNKVIAWAKSCGANSLGEDTSTYGAMFTPYGIYNCTSVGKQVMLPASHGYLSAMAVSSQVNGNWAAVAGVARGSIPNLVGLCLNVTTAVADSYQNRDGISINPITNVKPYGLLLWGNRTLKNNAKKGDLTATSFLSIRQLTNDVKRTVWVAAKSLTFEQNDGVLWLNFRSKITPTLDLMVSGGGISGYEIKKVQTTKKATVCAKLVLYAVEPVEDWDITIELADNTAEIAG